MSSKLVQRPEYKHSFVSISSARQMQYNYDVNLYALVIMDNKYGQHNNRSHGIMNISVCFANESRSGAVAVIIRTYLVRGRYATWYLGLIMGHRLHMAHMRVGPSVLCPNDPQPCVHLTNQGYSRRSPTNYLLFRHGGAAQNGFYASSKRLPGANDVRCPIYLLHSPWPLPDTSTIGRDNCIRRQSVMFLLHWNGP